MEQRMQKTSITSEILNEWFADIVQHRPQAMSSEERADAHKCIAACFHPDHGAAFVRLATAAGDRIDLRLNPAMVQVLREALLVCATTAGWMDADGGLVTRKPEAGGVNSHLRVA